MTLQETDPIQGLLRSIDPATTDYAAQFVDRLLNAAKEIHCSDVHLQPNSEGLDVRWRLDGVLQTVGTFRSGETADVVTRLKVLAGLLTYRKDVPQEGRIRADADTATIEMRVSTFPTIFGERAVIRLFADPGKLLQLDQLGLTADGVEQIRGLLLETTGALLITGPAGAGKTTTAYACLRHLVRLGSGGRSIVSMEDPVEVVVPGVAQSEANPAAEFDLHSGLKSMLRQDPEVIFVGEIRDKKTAEVAFQAALTGQLVLTTFHAGSAAEAIRRLMDMGLEPYLLRSGLLGILSQRLVRKLCQCATETENPDGFLGLPVEHASDAGACAACRHTGYAGRALLAELLQTRQDEVGQAILSGHEASRIEKSAIQAGMTPLWTRALEAVENRITSPTEVRRVFGLRAG